MKVEMVETPENVSCIILSPWHAIIQWREFYLDFFPDIHLVTLLL